MWHGSVTGTYPAHKILVPLILRVKKPLRINGMGILWAEWGKMMSPTEMDMIVTRNCGISLVVIKYACKWNA